MSKSEIAIVAYDMISSAGLDVETSWQHLIENKSCIRKLTRLSEAENSRWKLESIPFGAEIPCTYEQLAGSRGAFDKWYEPGIHAVRTLAQRTLKSVNFDLGQHDPQRIALFGGTALAGHVAENRLHSERMVDPKYILTQCHNMDYALASTELGLRGPSFSIGSACASAAHSLLIASQFLQAGVLDATLVVSREFPVVPSLMTGLNWLSALFRWESGSDRSTSDLTSGSRPFSQDRKGFVLGEGAGAMLLTTTDYARKHGWPIHAILRGSATNSDAGHITRPNPENVAFCIKSALQNAGCAPEQLGNIQAHATSTPLGDASELLALQMACGEQFKSIPITAAKSQLGHCLGASGIISAILAIKTLETGIVLPVLHYQRDKASPEALIFDRATEHACKNVLVNSFGFGGTNVSLVFGAYN